MPKLDEKDRAVLERMTEEQEKEHRNLLDTLEAMKAQDGADFRANVVEALKHLAETGHQLEDLMMQGTEWEAGQREMIVTEVGKKFQAVKEDMEAVERNFKALQGMIEQLQAAVYALAVGQFIQREGKNPSLKERTVLAEMTGSDLSTMAQRFTGEEGTA